MIVTRGLGRPGGLLVSGGLGRILYETPDGRTWAMTSTGWELVTAMYVHDGVSWVEVPSLSVYQSGSWVRVW